jgi:hypothetical protein
LLNFSSFGLLRRCGRFLAFASARLSARPIDHDG